MHNYNKFDTLSSLKLVLSIIILLSYFPGKAQTDTVYRERLFSANPSCDCDSLWSKPVATEFTQLLGKVTAMENKVWPGYKVSSASFVIDAGKINDGSHCLGLWKRGKAVSYAKILNPPRMLTPIYSYYLNYAKMDSIPSIEYFSTADNAPAFRKWMQQMKVRSAVYMPVDFSRLPFKLPTLVKIQLAIHEAFHVEVMLKYWYTGEGQWPEWDKQPDRKQMQVCYTYNDTGRLLIQKELSLLSNMIEALLDNDNTNAGKIGEEYITARENRYKQLQGVSTLLANGETGDCRTAESLFELEEGLADYRSWTFLFNAGIAGREDLLKRYRAKQNDHFYLSGCMLMHAIQLMSKKSLDKIVHRIITATSVQDGSLFELFKMELTRFTSR